MQSFLLLLTGKLYKLFESILVFCMVIMFILIFINVAMRFIINDSIDLAEELPRFLFIWMTFIGAILALKENTHISVNIVVSRLPPGGKKICWLACQILIFICGIYMLYGTWLQHDILKFNLSPVMMVSMLFVYGVSYISGLFIALISLLRVIYFFCGYITIDDLYPEIYDVDALEREAKKSELSKDGL
ncbi:MAG: TRAP transporter small permease [Aeromonas hydrophila]